MLSKVMSYLLLKLHGCGMRLERMIVEVSEESQQRL